MANFGIRLRDNLQAKSADFKRIVNWLLPICQWNNFPIV